MSPSRTFPKALLSYKTAGIMMLLANSDGGLGAASSRHLWGRIDAAWHLFGHTLRIRQQHRSCDDPKIGVLEAVTERGIVGRFEGGLEESNTEPIRAFYPWGAILQMHLTE